MGNCQGRLIGGEHEEGIPSGVRSLATPTQTLDLPMIALGECAPSVDEVALGDCGSAKTLEATMVSRRELSSDADHEIERSKVHWSELRGFGDGEEDSDDEEAVIRENRLVFAELRTDPRWTHRERGAFFTDDVRPSIMGRKIAEGGQAEIFEALDRHGNVSEDFLLKVFKKGSRLIQLRQQWPFKVLQQETVQVVLGGLIMEDGRFAFLMAKCWGDLRTLIVQAMRAKNSQGPPFPFEWDGVTMHALDVMEFIAYQMVSLHKKGVLHRDMKAFNVLLYNKLHYPHVIVADFECSVGVVGTGFWRAPEILLGLKSRGTIDFSEKVDVYGFGMTCFEIVTGRLPFEGELEQCQASYDLVIEGRRPKLPGDLNVALARLIQRCWDPNPDKRPAFVEIARNIQA